VYAEDLYAGLAWRAAAAQQMVVDDVLSSMTAVA
jgi:hypothetical protein